MRDIYAWLIDVEEAAIRFYQKAQTLFPDDHDISAMLNAMLNDEKRHYAVVKAIYDLTEGMEGFDASVIKIDKETIDKTADILGESARRLDSGALTKDGLMDTVITFEMSEHNDFFLYAVKSVKGRLIDLFESASDMGEHRDHIKRLIEARTEFGKFLEKIQQIPVTAKESLLIVDDDTAMTETFQEFLSREGLVECASNGVDALKKIQGKYYAAIIIDVNMPVMSGIEFYKKAVEMYPSIKDRFIFLTNFGEENCGFFEENGVKYFDKPASLSEIKKAIDDVMRGRAA